jgi:transposase
VTDARGVPLAVEVTAGQCHESTMFESVFETLKIGRRSRPLAIAGDKAYDVNRIRQWCRRRGIKAIIPTKRKQHIKPGRPCELDSEKYRKRNTVERCIGWLKCCRRIATRFEKLAVHFVSMIKMAMIQRCLRLLAEPSNRT